MHPASRIFFSFLSLLFFHDLLIQRTFLSLLPESIKTVEECLDEERRPSERLQKRIRYIEKDDKRTKNALEYILRFEKGYFLLSSAPSFSGSYTRIKS